MIGSGTGPLDYDSRDLVPDPETLPFFILLFATNVRVTVIMKTQNFLVLSKILFYKIVYNLVAVPLPQYLNHPVRMTRHMHPLHLVQIPATAGYYKYSFFPLAIVQWNQLPHHILVLPDLDSFRSAVRTVSHLMP